MGTILASEKKIFYEEDLKYKAAVSAAIGFKMGKMLNWLRTNSSFQFVQFKLNGPYPIGGANELRRDGKFIFPFDAEIFKTVLEVNSIGSSGTTELDAKVQTTKGGAYTSIYTVTPKVTTTATADEWITEGETLTGWTAPVLTTSPLNVAAGSAIKVDKIQSMTGAEDASLTIYFRSR